MVGGKLVEIHGNVGEIYRTEEMAAGAPPLKFVRDGRVIVRETGQQVDT